MPTTFIVAANGSRARFFVRPSGCTTCDEVHEVVLPSADGSEDDAQRLAHSVAGYVRQAHEAEAFHDIILIGSEEFRQRLRTHLGERVASLVAADIEGDCTRLSAEQVLERIEAAPRRH